MSRLQMKTDSYETDKKYDILADKLAYMPAVFRAFAPGIPLLEQEYLLSSVAWSRGQYLWESGESSEVRKGNFNDGETIQITASEGTEGRCIQLRGNYTKVLMQNLCTPFETWYRLRA